jgi:hypothetical protein
VETPELPPKMERVFDLCL